MGHCHSKSKKETTKKNSNVIKIKPYTDLVMTSANRRLYLHATNMKFLLASGVIPPLVIIIFEYVNFYDNEFRYDLLASSKFAGSLGLFKLNPNQHYLPESQQAEILARAHIWTAGSLNALEDQVKINPHTMLMPVEISEKLNGVEFTFVGSPLQLSFMLIDHTIQAANDSVVPEVIDHGQAEMLMHLIKEHIPERMSEAKEQARIAAPLDPEAASRKAERLKILNAAFEEIKANDFVSAQKIILDFIIGIKPEKITDNRLFSGLFRMISEAFELLFARILELKNDFQSDQADQYCLLIGMIQRFLPFKLRNVLEAGVFQMLYQGVNIDRTLDTSDKCYLKKEWGELGVNHFYRATGPYWRGAMGILGRNAFRDNWSRNFFEQLSDQLQERCKIYAVIEPSDKPLFRFMPA